MDTADAPSSGKVLLHFVMSLDGFIADADGDPIGWSEGATYRSGIDEEYGSGIGAIFLDCDVVEAARIALEAARGRRSTLCYRPVAA